MNEIKFDVARMKELLMRLEEIKEQLGTSCKNSSDSMQQIYDNIKGERILMVILRYSNVITEEVAKMFVELDKLTTYLEGQIAKYVKTETSAIESLADVQKLLSTLEN